MKNMDQPRDLDHGNVNWLPSLVPEDAGLPFLHLQISVRAQKKCRAANCHTVGDVVNAIQDGRIRSKSPEEKTFQEICSALEEAGHNGGYTGRVNWAAIWKRRGIVMPALAMTSTHLQRLNDSVRGLGLGSLNLGKARNGLVAVGIQTVGELVDRARSGIGKLKNFNKVSQEEVKDALSALSESIVENGAVDWEQYAAKRGLKLIPEVNADGDANRSLLDSIPDMCRIAALEQDPKRGWEVIRRRLILDEKKRETLDELATVYGITRERIRQIEETVISSLTGAIINDDYGGLGFRLREGLAGWLRRARKNFSGVSLPAWTETDWIKEISEYWNVHSAYVKRYDLLLVRLMGFRYCASSEFPAELDALIVDEAMSEEVERRLVKASTTLHAILIDEATGLDAFEIVRRMHENGIREFGIDDVPSAASLCSTVECVGESLYRAKFQHLRGRSNEAIRVLAEAGRPLSSHDIMREINKQLMPGARIRARNNLVNQMVQDNRLCAIGAGGLWALREWGVETRSLIEIIQDVLETAGEPLGEGEITKAVLERRHGSPNSIKLLLCSNPDMFQRVSRSEYGLTLWGRLDPRFAPDELRVGDIIDAFFADRVDKTVNFIDLRRIIESRLGINTRSAAGVLRAHPAVEIELSGTYKRAAIYCENWKSNPGKREPIKRVSSKPRQADLIAAAVEEMIKSGSLPLIEVVEAVESKIGVSRPAIYAAISQSNDFVKYVDPSTRVKLLSLSS